ncbi:hypothetical protein BG004_003557 [Podila humilis]|nr:hypothetical protein BG004_003557 [Podila humilis]
MSCAKQAMDATEHKPGTFMESSINSSRLYFGDTKYKPTKQEFNVWDTLFNNNKEVNSTITTTTMGEFRLCNSKLIQFLTAWTNRQGPHCQDLNALTRLREFCFNRLDSKLAKGLVGKLDSMIKKRWNK